MLARSREVRLAELVATLSLGIDLGFGQPMEHVIRACLIALRMGHLVGLDPSQRAILYYGGLLARVGCHSDAYEQAKWLGDDLAVKHDTFHHNFGRAGPTAAFMVKHVGGLPVAPTSFLYPISTLAGSRGACLAGTPTLQAGCSL